SIRASLLLAPILALAYPFWLKGFTASVSAILSGVGGFGAWAVAATTLIFAFATSGFDPVGRDVAGGYGVADCRPAQGEAYRPTRCRSSDNFRVPRRRARYAASPECGYLGLGRGMGRRGRLGSSRRQ